MSLTQAKNRTEEADKAQSPTPQSRLRSWLLTWEIYPIVLVTACLCLYRINTTEFNTDQASIFSMARDAIRYGLIPMTSNAASVGITNPPAVVYMLFIPALFSADPLWAAVQQGLLTTSAVLLTYIFTRRYYGRLAGIIASLLYATSATTIHYGRFIWQQNMLSPFIVLFMFALFWGVVERRKGWFAPAVLLLGLVVQLHESSALLAVLLLIAVVLAYKTLRWRDVGLAALLLCIIYLPYVLYEIRAHFIDLHTLVTLSKNHAIIDSQALGFYRVFLTPYGQQPTIPSSVINTFIPWIKWLRYVMPLLVVCGGLTAFVLLLQSRSVNKSVPNTESALAASGGIRGWWANLRSTPAAAGGLILLLTWQIVPLLALSRHTFILQLHYLIFLMPGPYILTGLFVTKVVDLIRQYQPRWSVLRYGLYALIGLVALGQLLGSVASVIDISSGNFDDRTFYTHYRNDLNSLQRALSETDNLAQQHHFSRVYITTDASTALALRYLSEQMQTPTTLFDASRCLVLPNPSDGPAALLVGPYDRLTNALLSRFARATLVDQPVRPGGAPFRLYIVTPAAIQPAVGTGTFGNDLQLLDVKTRSLGNDASLWTVTRWNFLRSISPRLRTTYTYTVTELVNGSNTASQQASCSFTSMRAGDQLLTAFRLSNTNAAPSSVTISVQSFTTTPYNPSFGPLHFETYIDQDSPLTPLSTSAGGTIITMPSS